MNDRPHTMTSPTCSATLHRYTIVTAIMTFLLLIAGGLVTSTDSGLAVPDWPLSYGMWFPPMVGGIFYEHGHRMLAGLVGMMILALTVWLWRMEPRRWVRVLGYCALNAVIIQALLGGLTVLMLLPPAVSIAHACVGPTVFCLVIALARVTSSAWSTEIARITDHDYPSLRVLGVGVGVLATVQLMLGAVIRHTGAGVALHLLGALVFTTGVAWLMMRLRCARRVLLQSSDAQAMETLQGAWAHAHRLMTLLGAQLIAGFSVLAHRGVVILKTVHHGIGILIVAQAVVLAWELVRRTTPAVRPTQSAIISQNTHRQHIDATALHQRYADYLELTKPRLASLVLVTAAVGFWVGAPSSVPVSRLCWLLLGMAFVVGGANALNQWMERAEDGLMERTKSRPLPAGRLTATHAHHFGVALIVCGTMILTLTVNILSASLAVGAAAIYLYSYTPLKRVTSLCTLVGAIPGALPPMIGWAAARNTLGLEAWVLFALLFLWQLPHFLALAILYRDDYARAGFQMLSVTEPDGGATARQTVLYGAALLPVSLLPALIGLRGAFYFFGALILSVSFLILVVRSATVRSRATARQLFLGSIVYLPLLMMCLVIG